MVTKKKASRRSRRSSRRPRRSRHGDAAAQIEYTTHDIDRDGTVWGSPPQTPVRDLRDIKQVVGAAWFPGHHFWAEDMQGRFLYGLNPTGQHLSARPSVPATKPSRARRGKKIA